MADLTLAEIDDLTLRATGRPGGRYLLALAILAGGVATLLTAWLYQVRTGMGVAGLNHPVGWGVYIGNFVFWVGIAHSGTLISAILYLLRARWRDAVSRSAEAMTVFAIMVAGLFPLIHLGRFWVFYYILPYPSQREIWPSFKSALVWDLVAILTYLTVSLIFFYVGLIPDLASVRDRFRRQHGPRHWATRVYGAFALGWTGAASQWRHYRRGYLFFAAFATPLVISVHSVVSWDFASGILPGWHTTLYAPYFVAGAIHSGLAMVLTLLIPMRRLLRLERLITPHHLGMVAQTIVVTALIVGYSYVIEPFIGWYTGEIVERQFVSWRATGPEAWIYWALIPLNVLIPLLYVFRGVRRNLKLSFAIAILVNVGMWLERFHIVTASTSHDFLPHAWGDYAPSIVEVAITAGSFATFLFLFLLFSRTLPTVPMADVKEALAEDEVPGLEDCRQPGTVVPARGDGPALIAVYGSGRDVIAAAAAVCRAGYHRLEVFSPVKLAEVERAIGWGNSPVRFWTLGGALGGLAGGFWLPIGTSLVNNLIQGGKHPVSLIPYCIIAFELTVLGGAIATLAGLLVHARLRGRRPPAGYDPRFSRDKFGLLLECDPDMVEQARRLLAGTGAEEVHARR